MDSEMISTYGTLGCMATHPVHGTVLLTNHHVLYSQHYDNTPSPVERDIKVGQPGISCSWCCECNVIGLVKDSRRRNNGDVDCGIAKINSDIAHINEISGGQRIVGIAALFAHPVTGQMVPTMEGLPVKKTGATTGFTEGEVTRVNSTVVITEHDNVTTTTLNNQIEFISQSGTNTKVVDGGDSGSVLLNNANEVVGLVCAGSVQSAPYDGVANDIHNVISIMNITINQTPAGSGSSANIEAVGNAVQVINASDDENTYYQQYFDKYRQKLEQTVEGKDILRCIKEHAKEIRELVFHNRRVIVAWQRNEGPAFVATIVRFLKKSIETIPREVNGIYIEELLHEMEKALLETGSDALKTDIEKYAARIYKAVELCHSNDDLINYLTSLTKPVQSN